MIDINFGFVGIIYWLKFVLVSAWLKLLTLNFKKIVWDEVYDKNRLNLAQLFVNLSS